MAVLLWLVLLYIVVALGCWMVFGRRFLFAQENRRPRNVDAFDLFGPFVGILLLGSAIIAMNPGRFVRAVGRSVLWPVTLGRWIQRRSDAMPADADRVPERVGSASISAPTPTPKPPPPAAVPDAPAPAALAAHRPATLMPIAVGNSAARFCDRCGRRRDVIGQCPCTSGLDGPTIAMRPLTSAASPGSLPARIDLAARTSDRRAWALAAVLVSAAAVSVAMFCFLLGHDPPRTTATSGVSSSAAPTVEVGSVSATSGDDDPAGALEGRRRADRTALAGATGTWLPQISSKRVGLVADGITYDDATIWRQFEAALAHHPDARLVNTSDWGSFRQGSYWVTLIDERFGTPAEANAWCDSNGYPTDQCYAKRLAVGGGFSGNTVMRH